MKIVESLLTSSSDSNHGPPKETVLKSKKQSRRAVRQFLGDLEDREEDDGRHQYSLCEGTGTPAGTRFGVGLVKLGFRVHTKKHRHKEQNST